MKQKQKQPELKVDKEKKQIKVELMFGFCSVKSMKEDLHFFFLV